MEQVDVLIVGGGPAGAACAWKLGQHRADFLLLDKADFPRGLNPARAGSPRKS